MTALTITAQLDLADAWEHEARDTRGRWFHGSNRVFKPGDVIDPSQAHAKNMRGSADDRFYLTSDKKTAKTYADMVSGHNPILGKRPGMSGEPHVYEVEPLGQVEPDYRPGTARTPGKVRVVREVPQAELGLANTVNLAAAANPQPEPPPQQQPPPPPQPDPLDDVLLATVLAELLITAVSAAAVVAALKLRFTMTKAVWTAMGGVLGDVMQAPPPVTGVVGHASAQTSRMNAARRAQYVLAAAKRVVGAMREARSQGKPVLGAMKDQLATERRYYQQHQKAMWDRATAAGKVDMEAAVHGPLLGWYARHDDRVTPECLKAHGCNFYVSNPPDIGLPGIGPHVNCRCTAGAPWPGGKLLPTRNARYARAA